MNKEQWIPNPEYDKASLEPIVNDRCFDPVYPEDPFDDFPDTDLGVCGECEWVGLLDDCPKSRSLMINCPRCLRLGMDGEIVIMKPSRESVKIWKAERPEIKSLKWFHIDFCSYMEFEFLARGNSIYNWSTSTKIPDRASDIWKSTEDHYASQNES